MTVLKLRTLGVTAGIIALSVPMTPAAADDVGCGDVITASTTLTHDLLCGPGDALVIGADGVVLDLGGHSVSGPGAYGAGAGAGVRVAQRHDVSVLNGELSGFAEAVVLDQSWGGTVSGLDVHDNDRGINLAGGGEHLVEKNLVHDNGRDAVRLGLSTANVVSKNVVTGNVFGIGVADGSSGNLVEKNVATGNTVFGVAAYSGATGTTFSKNVVSFSHQDGIVVGADAVSTLVEKNEAHHNGDDGIDVDSASTTVTKNVALHNGDLGIEAVDGVTDGGGNLAEGNGNLAQCTGVACAPLP